MAFDTLCLEHSRTGERVRAPVGFSWTMMVFGPLPALLRGDLQWAVPLLAAAVAAALAGVPWLGGLPATLAAFVWNRSYLNRLVGEGFQVISAERGPLERVEAEMGRALPRFAASAASASPAGSSRAGLVRRSAS